MVGIGKNQPDGIKGFIPLYGRRKSNVAAGFVL
jgi:hypothetical protein